MSASDRRPLVLDRSTTRDLIEQIYRLFLPHTENVSIHLTEDAIQILAYSEPGNKFILPEGPLDIRFKQGGKSEWITNPRIPRY